MNAPDSEVKDVKVSVCLTTYNHERFVRQAIESVLMQETDFDYELVIGEDCSTDGTRAIVRDYAAYYPELIRPLLQERNQGMISNFVAVLKACRGQYVALLEGDDYWTDTLKLQKQVHFLERTAHAFCYHHALYQYDDGSEAPQLPGIALRKPIARVEDLLFPVTIPTCSVVFRRSALPPLPGWYFELPFGDWSLWILLASNGTVAYLPENMAVYRVHSAGVSSSWDPAQRLHGLVDMFNHVNRYFDYRYDAVIRRRLSRYLLQLAVLYADRGDQRRAKHYLKQALRGQLLNSGVRVVDLLVTISRLYTPPIYSLGKRIFA